MRKGTSWILCSKIVSVGFALYWDKFIFVIIKTPYDKNGSMCVRLKQSEWFCINADVYNLNSIDVWLKMFGTCKQRSWTF